MNKFWKWLVHGDEREKETLLNSIRKMMEKLNLTSKQAMDILDIPDNKQREYATLI